MEILVFAKNRTTKAGKKFTTYVSKLAKKDGSEVTTAVKFRNECGAPLAESCPMYINVSKADCNFNSNNTSYVDDETGEVKEVAHNELWVTKWTKSSKVWKDDSMDDFVD